MAKPLTQSKIDAIWRTIEAHPDWIAREIAVAVGVSAASVWKVRRDNIREAPIPRQYTTNGTGLWNAPQVKPKHVTAAQFSDQWWDQNDRAFRAAMSELVEAAE